VKRLDSKTLVGIGTTFVARWDNALHLTGPTRSILRFARKPISAKTGAVTLQRALLFAVLWVPAALAQPELIPEAEALQPPTAARLAAIHAAAQHEGWASQTGILRAAAMHAYNRDKLPAAEAWLHVYRWASVFGLNSTDFIPRWVDSINAMKVGHSNMPRKFSYDEGPLGRALAPELQRWLIGNPAVSEEYFSLITPVDYLPRVFQILNELHARDPAKFKTYIHLALAIAVVYDVPPPQVWPHGQVSAEALPRKFPEPASAFAWFVQQDQLGRTYHRLTRLEADELKFVVDVAAPFAELEWAQQNVHEPLSQLAAAYSMIRYRTDRAVDGVAVWPGATYRLPDILKAGGICADQAYFANEVGKAHGVPTLFFYGAGNDARHAWFGYLDGNQKWQLDAGRYAEQRFVTGLARDPQTWRDFSDHDLQFLTERFRALPSFRQSQLHAAFAAELLAAGDAGPAATAARKAVNYERRNQAAWEILFRAAAKQGRDAKAVEVLLREAALAFQRYPDLEAAYVNRVAESLRSRGETSAAEAEIRRIAHKNEGERGDLSIQQARNLVQRAMQTQPLPEQVRVFNSTVDSFGRGAGIGFFDEVVTVFVEHLVRQQQVAEAARAVERARHTLKVEPNSQLEGELNGLAAFVKSRGK
jgi:hypothetical protein